MPKSLIEHAALITDKLHEIGIIPHTQSRISRMQRVVCDPEGNPRVLKKDDVNIEIAIESLRDIQQLSFILEHLIVDPDSLAYRKLRRALKDSTLPQEDEKQSFGRDTQFELYIAAICIKAELVPVNFAEPDVRAFLKEQQFGIAAKRLKSIGNLEKNIRNAGNQIRDSGLPGIIALDTCVAFNNENERIVAPLSGSEFGKRYGEFFRIFIDEYNPRIQEWVRAKGVRGIIFHDHQLRADKEHGWTLQSMTFSLSTARKNQRRGREFQAFDRQYKQGLPT